MGYIPATINNRVIMKLDTPVLFRRQPETVVPTIPIPAGLCPNGLIDTGRMQSMWPGVRDGVTNTCVCIPHGRVPVSQNVILWWLATGTDVVELFPRQGARNNPGAIYFT